MSPKLEKVFLSSDVYLTCMTHSLSTEVEEVMGLLIGWVNYEHGIVYITHCVQLKRLDKRKDRVEISDEQLYTVFPIVDEVNQQTKQQQKVKSTELKNEEERTRKGPLGKIVTDSERSEELRTVGWYHSHPHITVFPSQVDVRTQNIYQNADSMWTGMIFGVFNDDKQGAGNIPYIAFQGIDHDYYASGDNEYDFDSSAGAALKHRLVPVYVMPRSGVMVRPCPVGDRSIKGLVKFLALLFEEIEEVYQRKRHDQDPKNKLAAFHSATVVAASTCNVLENLAVHLISALESRKKLLEHESNIAQE